MNGATNRNQLRARLIVGFAARETMNISATREHDDGEHREHHVAHSTRRLFAAPHWLALVEKRADPLLRVGRHRVLTHYFFRVVIGFGLIEVDLRIEGLLADARRSANSRRR